MDFHVRKRVQFNAGSCANVGGRVAAGAVGVGRAGELRVQKLPWSAADPSSWHSAPAVCATARHAALARHSDWHPAADRVVGRVSTPSRVRFCSATAAEAAAVATNVSWSCGQYVLVLVDDAVDVDAVVEDGVLLEVLDVVECRRKSGSAVVLKVLLVELVLDVVAVALRLDVDVGVDELDDVRVVVDDVDVDVVVVVLVTVVVRS